MDPISCGSTCRGEYFPKPLCLKPPATPSEVIILGCFDKQHLHTPFDFVNTLLQLAGEPGPAPTTFGSDAPEHLVEFEQDLLMLRQGPQLGHDLLLVDPRITHFLHVCQSPLQNVFPRMLLSPTGAVSAAASLKVPALNVQHVLEHYRYRHYGGEHPRQPS
jgi:hypothetical protein